jgi:hypothetical protein
MAELVGKLVVKNKAIFSILKRVATPMGCQGPREGEEGMDGELGPRSEAANHLGSQAR